MGNRLHVSVVVNLRSDTSPRLLGELFDGINGCGRFSFIRDGYSVVPGGQVAALYKDEGAEYHKPDGSWWLRIDSAWKNYNGELETLLAELESFIIPFSGKDTPIGWWEDDSGYGFIFCDGMRKE